ncbi:hypothetical protein; putative signal peptide [Frankia alni ACN14a]|uniref:Uncharacterized protein n=1 Tax=Frankia alni (strain DSM 45986 / CECT 9034 / ACN14a) TaxID=326424 RepID=Q0RCJ2_FRAAA|nr:hypothetical protein; putative signal peptide [Frankia alni ACN14a]
MPCRVSPCLTRRRPWHLLACSGIPRGTGGTGGAPPASAGAARRVPARPAAVRSGSLRPRFHPSLRVKAFTSKPGLFEMTWAPDGRALWTYGDPLPGRGTDPHVIWLRVGTHDIFRG